MRVYYIYNIILYIVIHLSIYIYICMSIYIYVYTCVYIYILLWFFSMSPLFLFTARLSWVQISTFVVVFWFWQIGIPALIHSRKSPVTTTWLHPNISQQYKYAPIQEDNHRTFQFPLINHSENISPIRCVPTPSVVPTAMGQLFFGFFTQVLRLQVQLACLYWWSSVTYMSYYNIYIYI